MALSGDTVVNLNLTDTASLEEVTVYASGDPASDAPTFDLPVPMTALLAAPTLLGEADVLKSLQRLPGVQAGNDGGAELYVRGGSPGQNLILLDGVPVYNASHLFGFFSVFNPDVVNKVAFFKGGFPARYGGRLSSVIDIRLREGDRQQFHGTGSIGLLSSRLTLEGPIVKGKTSFLVSARRTYLDLFTRNIKSLRESDFPTYWFYDLTAKVNHTFSHRDQVYLSTYAGQDQLPADGPDFPSPSEIIQNPEQYGYIGSEGQYWGNLTTTLRWNHVYHQELFSNLTLTYSRYQFGTESRRLQIRQQPTRWTKTKTQRSAYIADGAARIDFDYLPSPAHYVRFGGGVTRHAFRPSAARLTINQNDQELLLDTAISQSEASALEYALFAEDEVQLSDQFSVNAGFHLTHFQVEGKSYTVGQPRLRVQYRPSTQSLGHASYSRMTQFVHLLTDPETPLPSDLWVPTTAEIPPETAHQWTLGYRRTWGASYAVQAEAYYKRMQNVLAFREGSTTPDQANLTYDWQTAVTSGRGESYGAELLAQKQQGRLTAWVGYTLQWSHRQFDEINQGKRFPFKYDRRHGLDVSGQFRWTDRINVSWGWGLATGFAITLPTVAFGELHPGQEALFDDSEFLVYGSRNRQRTRAAHRLDLSVSFRKETRWGERTWELGIYNVYSRKNPFSVSLETFTESGERVRQFEQTSLFPVLPSVNYRFRF